MPALYSARLQALLAYLLLHRPTPQLRQHLAFVFWPDSDEAQARTNLRNLLHRLRQAWPEADQVLSIETRSIGWRPGAPLQLDVAQFLEHLKLAQGDPVIVKAYGGWMTPDGWYYYPRAELRDIQLSVDSC